MLNEKEQKEQFDMTEMPDMAEMPAMAGIPAMPNSASFTGNNEGNTIRFSYIVPAKAKAPQAGATGTEENNSLNTKGSGSKSGFAEQFNMFEQFNLFNKLCLDNRKNQINNFEAEIKEYKLNKEAKTISFEQELQAKLEDAWGDLQHKNIKNLEPQLSLPEFDLARLPADLKLCVVV